MSGAVVSAQSLVLSPFASAAPFDFSVAPGEHWLLTGPSRSGKTPLLKTLCGLISPAAGQVTLLGQNLDDLAPSQLLSLRQKISFVFAFDGLMPAWSGFENLALPLKYYDRASDDEIIARVEEFAQRYDVPADWLNNPVAQLSGEKRAALSLLRALMTEPELLLIDAVPLDALVSFSGIRGAQLISDAIAGQCSVILALPEEAGGRLPAVLGAARLRNAEMRDGRLECLS